MQNFNIELRRGNFDGELLWEGHLTGSDVYEYADTIDEVVLLVTSTLKDLMGIDEPSVVVDSTQWSEDIKKSAEEIDKFYRNLSAEEELDLIRAHKSNYIVG